MLQVLNVRNISAPKANQESKTSPRLLLIDMTDGQTMCAGLEMENLSTFHVNIAPGTKIRLRNSIKIIQGMLSLTPQNIILLGGTVTVLYEKWEINRTLAKYATGFRRPTNGTGPPPWITFGQKVEISDLNNDKIPFKSLNAATNDKEKAASKENDEFTTTRNVAIAQANKLATKKLFGGKNRKLMDHNVKKIMEKGYSEDQAKYALKMARNNLERAMGNLKKRQTDDTEKSYDIRSNMGKGGRNERRGGGKFNDDTALASKPSKEVSLFEFFSDKMKISDSSTTTTSIQLQKSANNESNGNNSRYNQSQTSSRHQKNENPLNSLHKIQNNISSSYANRMKKSDEPRNSNHTNNTNNNNNNINNQSGNINRIQQQKQQPPNQQPQHQQKQHQSYAPYNQNHYAYNKQKTNNNNAFTSNQSTNEMVNDT